MKRDTVIQLIMLALIAFGAAAITITAIKWRETTATDCYKQEKNLVCEKKDDR